MSAHNIQLFSGAVEIPDDLRVVSLTVEDGLMELGANGAFANVGYVMNNPGGSNAAVYYDKISDQLRVVHTDFGGKEGPNTVTIKNEDITMNVSGNVHADFFRGDGGLLSNLVSDLQSVTAVEANSDQMIILSNATALWANVGNVLVEGNVTAGEFHGDGGWLTNVQTTFEETIVNGNTTSNIVEFHNALSLVTTGNVGIQNVAPLGDLSIGANVVFDDDATDILKVQGNINCEVITIGQWVLGGGGAQGLQQITDTGNTTTLTPQFNNVSTAFVTTSKAGIGIAAPSSDAMLHVDGHVRLGGVADTPDNENMFVRAAGALNIIANHSNTDNTTSNLVMKAGEINAASITLAGAVTDDDRQRIVFKTRETEALTIDEFGNANFVSNVVVGTGAKFIGDGSGLTGLVSDLQSVSVGGATTNQTIKFTNATEGANISSNLYVGSNLHLDDVTLAAASVTLQGVTTNGATTTDAITITDTTEATTTSTGALKVSGGIAAAMDIRAANVVVNRVGVGLTAGANPDPAHLVEVDGNVKATNVICESLTLDSVALQTLYSLDQVVNVNNTTSNIVVISNTTPSTSLSTGCLQLSGGLGVNGNVYAQEFVNTNAGGWRLTHTHSTRPTVNGATVGGELTGGNGDVETGFLRLSGGGSTAGTGAPKSYIDICGASASTDFANNITFGIKGSEKVRLTDVGLGVGTVSPSAKLDVSGTGRFTNNGGSLQLTGNDHTYLEYYPDGLSAGRKAWVGYGASTDDNFTIYNEAGSGHVVLGSGNVGIGTTNPGNPLHVFGLRGTSQPAYGVHLFGRSHVATSNVYAGIEIHQTGGAEIDFGDGSSDYKGRIAYRNDSNKMEFYTNANRRMVINSSGNVGIGTTNPLRKFQIGMNLGHLGGYIDTYIQSGVVSGMVLGVKQQGGTDMNALHISDSGLVGIGTTNPGAPLEITSNQNADTWSKVNSIFNVLHDNNNGGYYGMSFAVSATHGDGVIQTYNVASGNAQYDLRLQPSGGNVGIRHVSPSYPLHVAGSAGNMPAMKYFNSGSTNIASGANDAITIYAAGNIYASGLVAASDERIKKEIIDADDAECLDTLRLLKPKKYRYRDELNRGKDFVWGFIAQEVRETLPYATRLSRQAIPNIYELADVSSSNVITFSNFDTSNLEANATTIQVQTAADMEESVTIAEIMDEHTIRVEEDLSNWTGSVDETGNVVAGNQLFVYGQKIDDFVLIKKDAIWTVTTAALQEVDRQQQADKLRIAELETQLASVLARLDALENA